MQIDRPMTVYVVHYRGPAATGATIEIEAVVEAHSAQVAWSTVEAEHKSVLDPAQHGSLSVVPIHGPNAEIQPR